MNNELNAGTTADSSNQAELLPSASLVQNPVLSAVTFDAVKMIAFRDRDIENDIWCERVFMFKNTDEVKSFFTADNSVLLDVYTEEDNRVLNDFEIHDGNPAGNITSVSFNTEYAGDVRLYEMNEGFVCNSR
jgi:hypothetical protein